MMSFASLTTGLFQSHPSLDRKVWIEIVMRSKSSLSCSAQLKVALKFFDAAPHHSIASSITKLFHSNVDVSFQSQLSWKFCGEKYGMYLWLKVSKQLFASKQDCKVFEFFEEMLLFEVCYRPNLLVNDQISWCCCLVGGGILNGFSSTTIRLVATCLSLVIQFIIVQCSKIVTFFRISICVIISIPFLLVMLIHLVEENGWSSSNKIFILVTQPCEMKQFLPFIFFSSFQRILLRKEGSLNSRDFYYWPKNAMFTRTDDDDESSTASSKIFVRHVVKRIKKYHIKTTPHFLPLHCDAYFCDYYWVGFRHQAKNDSVDKHNAVTWPSRKFCHQISKSSPIFQEFRCVPNDKVAYHL